MWRGCLTALLTPFRGGEIDFAALERLVDAQVAGGVQGVVPCGSTGESATLTHDEHIRVVEAVVRFARGRVPVIAGTGSNSTAEAVRLTRAAEEAGAAGALLLSPYYNKPTQEGIYQHYAAVAEATKLPLVVYNIPGRTASNILPETIARLSQIENIVGVKEASGSMQQVIEIIAAAEPGFAVWSGDDVMTLPIVAAGGAGAIAVSSNIVPGRFVAVTDALLAGDFARARDLMYDLLPLVRVLTMRFEVNPIPVKTAAALIGLCAEEFRLPLTPMSPENRAQLERVLREYALVPGA
ncbi:MAG TPA: 4-hydroxy-tetrahydrodipicolinate synthase [Candidatus Binatia bacterium]|nr:4-hydroxy-tetrahydrodipicolinate synthase [Candidatus Binatia bacterium]